MKESVTAVSSDAAATTAPPSFAREPFSARSAQAAPASGRKGSTWWTMSQPAFSPRYAYIATDESAQPATKRSANVNLDQRVATSASAGRTIANSYCRRRGRVERLRAGDALHL